MARLMVRQRTTDFAQWEAAFHALDERRAAAGITTAMLMRVADDPDEVVVIFDVEDAEAAKAHQHSDKLREAHQRGAVVEGSTTATFLEPVTP